MPTNVPSVEKPMITRYWLSINTSYCFGFRVNEVAGKWLLHHVGQTGYHHQLNNDNAEASNLTRAPDKWTA